MPNRNKAGNQSRGGGAGRGRGRVGQGTGPLGSDTCVCPNCSHKHIHVERGVPCAQIKCEKCGTLMKGEYC